MSQVYKLIKQTQQVPVKNFTVGYIKAQPVLRENHLRNLDTWHNHYYRRVFESDGAYWAYIYGEPTEDPFESFTGVSLSVDESEGRGYEKDHIDCWEVKPVPSVAFTSEYDDKLNKHFRSGRGWNY